MNGNSIEENGNSHPSIYERGRGRVCIYVGSFDPFHEGHKSIVDRALELFDKVVVGIGVNPDKQYMFSVEERIERIRQIYPNNEQIVIESYNDLTIDFAHRHGATYIIKGVRNAKDFVYEQEQALWNKEHGGIETILLLAEPGLENLSSTKVREELKEENL